MDFRKLPSNSEGLLLKLVCSENPTQVLRKQYNGLSTQQEQELDGIIRELKELGYIDVKWADNDWLSITRITPPMQHKGKRRKIQFS